MLAAHEVRFGHGRRARRPRKPGQLAVDGVSLTLPPGRTTALVGPNGSGKTTLLRLMYGALAPATGHVELDGRSLTGWSVRQRARRIAVVAQEAPQEIDLTVEEYVGLGRMARRSPYAGYAAADRAAARDALAAVSATEFGARRMSSLSGGERQRAHVARALAQGADHLLLDEPTNHLDVRHQHDVLGLVSTLVAERGLTSLVVLHDLNLAARYADHVVLLDLGRVVADGTPDEVCAPALVEQVYGIRCQRVPHHVPPHLVFDPAGHGPTPSAHTAGRR